MSLPSVGMGSVPPSSVPHHATHFEQSPAGTRAAARDGEPAARLGRSLTLRTAATVPAAATSASANAARLCQRHGSAGSHISRRLPDDRAQSDVSPAGRGVGVLFEACDRKSGEEAEREKRRIGLPHHGHHNEWRAHVQMRDDTADTGRPAASGRAKRIPARDLRQNLALA